MNIAWPWLLLALPLPWAVRALLPPASRADSAALRVPFVDDVALLAHEEARAPRPIARVLPLLAWALLCVAAARPQELGAPQQPPQSGRDLLLAVDLSGSMAETDMTLGSTVVDRLTAVKAVLGDFLDRRAGDRVGLLLFGDKAFAVTPLTPDRESVRQQLYDSAVGIAGRETAIGDAIGLAVKRLAEPRKDAEPAGDRVVILLTDGVNNAGELTPEKAAQLAHVAGVRVHAIGFGGAGDSNAFGWMFGMRMPGAASIDEGTLRTIAEKTGGRYFRARDTAELAQIYAELDRIEPVARKGETLRPRIEHYPLPLALALGLAALAFVARVRGAWREAAA
jgi:Ca-activated chloride channel family protein